MSCDYVHNLFWAGINNDSDINLGFLKKSIVDKSFLKNFKDPYYIYTGNSCIESFKTSVLSDQTRTRLNDTTLHIFLYEPLCLKVNGNYNFSFYSEFSSTIPTDTITCDTLDSINTFINNNDLKSVKICITDCNAGVLQQFYPDLDIVTLDLYLLQVSADLLEKPTVSNNFTKKFWCGNRRYTAHRHLIMSKLVSLSGNYSWPYDCDIDILKNNVWYCDYTADILQGCNLLNQVTLSLDTVVSKIKITKFNHYAPDGTNRLTNGLAFSYADSFCAVVNETRFAQPMPNVSEKTIWPIYYKMPVIVVGAAGSLEYLKSLGFKTFDCWWDESYDQEADHQARLKKIFTVIDYINSKSIEDLKIIYSEMQDVLEHNQQVAINLKTTLSDII
jgi:hypothetical protein